MDSRAVNALIRADVWPLLRGATFTAFSSRTAWRYSSNGIDALNFQSFNSYNASVLGCTTYSFGINLGKLLSYIPYSLGEQRLKQVGGRLRPEEYQCHLRRQLHKRLPQESFPRSNIWFVDPAGGNVREVIADAVGVVRDALPWFERFESVSEVLRTVRHDAEDIAGTWGFGNNPSPNRHYVRGFAALRVGETSEAREHLLAALSSGCFEAARANIAAALNGLPPPASA